MKNKLAIGAIIGAAAGMVAGILTAPKSGKETRADIKVKAEELKNHASQKADGARDAAETVKNKATEAVNDAVDSVKERLR